LSDFYNGRKKRRGQSDRGVFLDTGLGTFIGYLYSASTSIEC
jgi:hypothetical protein